MYSSSSYSPPKNNGVPYPTSELDMFSLSERRTKISASPSSSSIKVTPAFANESIEIEISDSTENEKLIGRKPDKLVPKLIQLKEKFKRPKSVHRLSSNQSNPGSIIFMANEELKKSSYEDVRNKEKNSYENDIFEESIPFIPAKATFVQRTPVRKDKKNPSNEQRRTVRNSKPFPIYKIEREKTTDHLYENNNPDIPILGTFFTFVDNTISREFPLLQPYRKHIKITLILIMLYQFHLITELLVEYISDMVNR